MTNGEQSIDEVRSFWENNPLFVGESKFQPGTREFFEEQCQIYTDDVFAGHFPAENIIPNLNGKRALDLGCGIGFWTIEMLKRNSETECYSADLTQNALDITQQRLDIYELNATLSRQDAEHMTFADEFFDHVNCQGVVHHTPNTQRAVAEIARVLKPGGTASISVYYRNFFLRHWEAIRILGMPLSWLGGGLKGRGRESIFRESDPNEITRLYDGDENPIGKSYDRHETHALFEPHFEIEKDFLFFFPARALPFPIPGFLHRWLDRNMGFMIHVNLRKR